jgi:acyl carrier protein
MYLREVAELLAAVTGDSGLADRITLDTSVEEDLQLESVELAALGELMRQRYGPRVDLSAYLASLDLDQLISLRVSDLVALVVAA